MEEKNLNEQQKNIKETTTQENSTGKTMKCGCKKGILISGIIGILLGMTIMFILGTTRVIDFENKILNAYIPLFCHLNNMNIFLCDSQKLCNML